MDDRQLFENGIRKFVQWLDRNGTAGYDPYDLWSTSFGTRARSLYYRFGKLAAPLVAPIIAADSAVPRIARLSFEKKPYATSHAHLILAYLDLHDIAFDDEDWLSRSVELSRELDRMKISGHSGDCWGYPFDWQNRRGLWPKNTPLITVTPYCYEANMRLYGTTGDECFRERALSTVDFALYDLNSTERSSGSIASSYSPLDKSFVINASAYRALVLFSGAQLNTILDVENLGHSLVEFILDSQNGDGSWPYALEEKGDDFVDHFHTCFVLKNLLKINEISPSSDIWKAVEKGFAYYEKELFDVRGLPKPFAKGRGKLVKYDLCDFAEAINLGILLRDRIPRAFEKALVIARDVVGRFQLNDGHFVTSVGIAGLKNAVPFIRWPQAQLFHSLASLRKALD